MVVVTGPRRPHAKARPLSSALPIVILVGALAVGLIWSGLNDLTHNGGLTVTSGVEIGFALLLMLAVVAWLWRYLSAQLPESQRSTDRSGGHR